MKEIIAGKKTSGTEPGKEAKAKNIVAKMVSWVKPLNKNQQTFNRLTAKIASLKKK